MKLYELSNDGQPTFINPDNVAFLSTTNLVRKTGIVLSNGGQLLVDGTINEVAGVLNGGQVPSRILQ